MQQVSPLIGDQIERQQLIEIEKPGAQAIVDIVVVIGDIIGNGGDLAALVVNWFSSGTRWSRHNPKQHPD